MPKTEIMPSILAADFGRLAEGCRRAEEAGAERLHVDVMDGVFVPNVSFGPGVVRMASKEVSIPLNVHLMVMRPQEHVEAFAEAGANTMLIHVEARCDVLETLQAIRALGKRAGVVLNPETPAEAAFEALDAGLADEALLMSVHPGFGGQRYLAFVEEKLTALRRHAPEIDLSVDGGIDGESAATAAAAGANLFVAGSYLYRQDDMRAAIDALRETARAAYEKAWR